MARSPFHGLAFGNGLNKLFVSGYINPGLALCADPRSARVALGAGLPTPP